MSVKEREWLKVLHEVKQGHMTQRAAAGRLKGDGVLGAKVAVRMKQKDADIVHRLRGRESNRRRGRARGERC